VVVDHDHFVGHIEEFWRIQQYRAMGVHNDQQGVLVYEGLGFVDGNKAIQACLVGLLIELSDRFSVTVDQDRRFFPAILNDAGNTKSGAKAIHIRIFMSHDQYFA